MMSEHTEVLIVQQFATEEGIKIMITHTGDGDRADDDEHVPTAYLIAHVLNKLFLDGTVFSKIKEDYGIDMKGRLEVRE